MRGRFIASQFSSKSGITTSFFVLFAGCMLRSEHAVVFYWVKLIVFEGAGSNRIVFAVPHTAFSPSKPAFVIARAKFSSGFPSSTFWFHTHPYVPARLFHQVPLRLPGRRSLDDYRCVVYCFNRSCVHRAHIDRCPTHDREIIYPNFMGDTSWHITQDLPSRTGSQNGEMKVSF